MADIPSVTPPKPTPPVSSNVTNAPVQQAPPAASAGSLSGTVVSSNPSNQQLTIQTAQGQVVIQSAAALPPDTPVMVELFTARAQLRANITVIKQEAAMVKTAAQMTTPPPLQAGSQVTALRLQMPAPGQPVPLKPGEWPPESQSLLQKLSAYLPQKLMGKGTPLENPIESDDSQIDIMRSQLQSKSMQKILEPQLPADKKPDTFAPLTSSFDMLISSMQAKTQEPSMISALLKQLMPQEAQHAGPQNMFKLHIAKILPPGTPAADLPPGTKLADVIATTPSGKAILQAGDDTFVLTSADRVPEGSKVAFTAAPLTAEESAQTSFGLPAASAREGLAAALQEALLALPPESPAAQALRNTLPRPDEKLPSTTLFFLAALRSGAVENWLGAQTLKDIGQRNKDLAAALTGDFEQSATQSKDIQPGGWRFITVPLRYEEQVNQMQFYVRQQREEGQKEEGDGKPATRFVLNVSLSRMGALQMDGFIQKKKFDMVLRTQDKLPFDMRQEIMKRFAQGLEQVQMQGGISFQTRQQGWMVIPDARNVSAEI